MKKIAALLLSCALAIGFLALPAEAYDMGKIGEYQTVSMGGTHTAVIKADGSLWAWGRNDVGQVGNSGKSDAASTNGIPYQSTPVKVLDNVVSVSCGDYHTAAIQGDGSLWVWGANNNGQVGSSNGADNYSHPIQTVPAKILDGVAAVSCGNNCTAAIKFDGTLWMWGGYGNLYGPTPQKIMDGITAVSMDDGCSFCSVIKKDGTLWVWGSLLGDNKYINVKYTNPVKIADNVASVSCGGSSLAYIKNDGTVWTWGSNSYGERGDGTLGSHATVKTPPTQVQGLSNVLSLSYGKGYTHVAVILADGSLWMWGANSFGQLGIGRTGNTWSGDRYIDPLQTVPIKIMDRVASVFCGSNNTAVIREDGTLWTWGDNAWGKLGYPDGDDGYSMSGSAGGSTWSTQWSFSWSAQTTPRQAAGFDIKPSGVGSPTVAALVAPAAPAVAGFTDVSASSPYADAIVWAVEKNITTGKTANTFAPGEKCTNGQILTFLWRASGSPEPTINNPFTDSIPASFQKAAVWAYEKGLVSGAVFGASMPCTRASTVTYLWKVAGRPESSKNAGFSDVPANAEYGQAVAWAVENGVTSGTGNGRFSPDATCTRGQIVTFLHRAMEK